MRTLFRLFAGFCLTACIASAHREPSPVSFVVGKQHFMSGDSIVIDQVLASSPKLDVGTKVVVRGHYRLASVAKASLQLNVTSRVPTGSTHIAPGQVVAADAKAGTFELSCEITQAGDPHVSFYPATGGESFGGVYFSAPGQKS